MILLSRPITFALLLAVLVAPQALRAQEASAWAEGHHSRVRLLAGGAEGGGHLAGVEIGLDPGFKTYWRHPGDAGLPPSLDWSGSGNLGAVEVLWPAPARFEDAAGVSYGYKGEVLFPVRVTPADPTRPVRLALKISYGICKDICIPAQAEMALALPAAAPPPATRARIEAALARVPRPQPLAAPGELAVVAARLEGAAPSRLVVTLRAPPGKAPALFVEGPDGWFFDPTPQPLDSASTDGMRTLAIDVPERPREGGPVAVRITLVAGETAVETTASLDAAALER